VAKKQTRKAAGSRRATKKTARGTKRAGATKKTTSTKRPGARKKAVRTSGAKKKATARKSAAKKAAPRKTAPRKAAAKTPAARKPASTRTARKKTAARGTATRARRSRPAPAPASTLGKATATVRGAIAGMVATVSDALPWTDGELDAIDILEMEHRRFEELLKQGEETTERATKGRRELLDTLAAALNAHELMEEQVLYPVLQAHPEAREVVLEGFEEHHVADLLIQELRTVATDDEQWGAKFKVLKENIEHHIQEEEGEMFRAARRIFSRDELRELGERMLAVRPPG
jgi:hemerythrin-like domain-containing protein